MNTSVSLFLVIFVIIYYIMPSAIIIILYWKIIIHQRSQVRPGHPSMYSNSDIARKDRLMKSLIIISACYICTTWPLSAVLSALAITQKSIEQVREENVTHFWLVMFSMLTSCTISVMNPNLYFMFDKNIQKSLYNRFLSCQRILKP